MEDKEQRLIEELKKCRSSIERSKHLIEKHKEILKKQEKRAAEIEAKLDREKMNSLYDLIHKGGYDIDHIRDVVSSGHISDISVSAPADAEADTQKTAENKEKSSIAAEDDSAERNK